jgi:hypothetical protein
MIFSTLLRSNNVQAQYCIISRSLQRRHSGCRIVTFKRGLSTNDSKNLDGLSNSKSTAPFETKETNIVEEKTTVIDQRPQMVYESPLGSVVSKLRTVSLMTAIIGMTGVPCMIALKGAIPEGGILAAAMLFVTGSVGSTAAIHFVFSPYVYRIEHIPIRHCSAKSSSDQNSDSLQKGRTSESSSISQKDTLLKAWTRSLLLFDTNVVFNPCVDVLPYKGMRPMCNLLAKGQPLYVHPGTLRKDHTTQMNCSMGRG